jgi:hypothetical protein
MGLLDRIFSRSKLWTDLEPSERRLIELLTADGVPEFARLRAQWGEPFWLGVDGTRQHKDRYELALVYDGSAVDTHSIGENVNFDIDDFFVLDRRLGTPLPCVGHVSNGILSNVIVSAPQPRRWPRVLAVDDWFYVGTDGARGKTRRQDWPARIAAARAMPAGIAADIDAVIPRDYREYMARANREWEVHDARLLRLPALYFLDDPRVSGRFLVFASFADASVLAFKIEDRASEPSGVHFVSVVDGQAERVAGSFSQWLKEGGR